MTHSVAVIRGSPIRALASEEQSHCGPLSDILKPPHLPGMLHDGGSCAVTPPPPGYGARDEVGKEKKCNVPVYVRMASKACSVKNTKNVSLFAYLSNNQS